MAKFDVLKYYLVPLILRLGLFSIFGAFEMFLWSCSYKKHVCGPFLPEKRNPALNGSHPRMKCVWRKRAMMFVPTLIWLRWTDQCRIEDRSSNTGWRMVLIIWTHPPLSVNTRSHLVLIFNGFDHFESYFHRIQPFLTILEAKNEKIEYSISENSGDKLYTRYIATLIQRWQFDDSWGTRG